MNQQILESLTQGMSKQLLVNAENTCIESVVINELISDVIDRWQLCQSATEDRTGRIKFRRNLFSEYCLNVRANSQRLRQVLNILVDNAIKAMVDLSIKDLTIISEFRNNGARILVRDTGRGIPSEVQPLLLKEEIPKPQGGMGTGLLVAKDIIEAYGGELDVVATGIGGTTMMIWLPLEWLPIADVLKNIPSTGSRPA